MLKRKLKGFLMMLSLMVVVIMLVGCGSGGGTSTGDATKTGTNTETTTKKKAEVLEVGETATVKNGKFSVTKVGVTNDIASPEASALLLTGETGEGTNSSKAPTAGNEFLMVTMTLKNTGSSLTHAIAPAYVKLTDSSGKEYEEVKTSGYGGIYNGKPIEAGSEGTTTAVFEVPAGKTGLTLTFRDDDYDEYKFKIR